MICPEVVEETAENLRARYEWIPKAEDGRFGTVLHAPLLSYVKDEDMMDMLRSLNGLTLAFLHRLCKIEVLIDEGTWGVVGVGGRGVV